MQIGTIEFIGLTAVVAAVTFVVIYLRCQRGIAVSLSLTVIGTTSAAAIVGFVYGKQGISLPAVLVTLFLISPAYILVILMLRFIVGPLKALSKAAQEIAEGDLHQTIEIQTRDEIGELVGAFNQMCAYLVEVSETAEKIASGNLAVQINKRSDKDQLALSLEGMIAALRQSIGKMTETADSMNQEYSRISLTTAQTSQSVQTISAKIQQVSGDNMKLMESLKSTTGVVEQMDLAIDEMAKGAQEQAQAVGEASRLMTQITQKITQVTEDSQAGSEGAAGAAETAHRGAKTIDASVERMDRIKHSAVKVQQKVGLMDERSQQIGSIVELIEEIASQTNWMEGVIDVSGGVPYITKTRCMHDGEPFCEYDVRWEMSATKSEKPRQVRISSPV